MELIHFIPAPQRTTALLAAQAEGAPVLIQGTSGTGKSALARWIHAQSPRALQIRVIADHQTPLRDQILSAKDGTLILPEIGSWGLADQRFILSVIQTRSLPLTSGDSSLRQIVNARIVATTSQSLEGRARSGLFNAELLKMFDRFSLEMPDLKDREEELPEIALALLDEITRELQKQHIKGFTPECWTEIAAYRWPGNLRELRNALRYAVIHELGDQISAASLPNLENSTIDFRATREQFEKLYLEELMKTAQGNLAQASILTRLDPTALRAKLEKHGIRV